MAKAKFSRHWKKHMTGAVVSSEWWSVFDSLKGESKKARRRRKRKEKAAQNNSGKQKIINPFTAAPDDWAWKPQRQDTPSIKRASPKETAKPKKKARPRKESTEARKAFYASDAWRSLRSRVLEKYESKCMCCGRSPRKHGVVLHVDHIKPRSKYPQLELDFNNLQILCEDCNIGKGNKYQTDYRPSGSTPPCS